MRKGFWGCLAGLLLLSATAARADLPEGYQLTLLTENFPPYNFSVDGKNFARDADLKGIAVDMVREMCQRAGIPYNLTLRFPWERIYGMALDQPDHGVFVTARLPEREALFKWVGPIGPDDWVLLGRPDSHLQLRNLDEVRKQQLKIGAYQGDAIAESLLKQGFTPELALRDQENVQRLLKGQIDVWATGDPAGRYLARQENVSGLKTLLRFNTGELFLALNKQTPDEVVQKLQKALDELRQTGEVQRIFNRYL
ncbi:substrate-binding periplasmic protein [Pseudomonas oryzihabitans]|uniref:Polar amino acid transport system substrate-binding protein n=1 Tax=Pseudomonas oryzihabitans TaxID=47885 RepID=A0AAJ2BGS9_9PSED|nr:ABC transporter substrate-binding protein [Pseudomonas psychrotolerans]MDR6234003.1 polar amino acid transport system substrate-binding protein [Pseudomonas psychrotolerans]MDR6356905.1 polar amino acid transport system substrate-binding protein [Pseudomonas psychrotolerans]